jgi:hypothetical protein
MSNPLIPDKTSSASDATYKPLGDNLFELTLSYQNKAELFDEAISKLSQNSHEASSILRNLTKWDATDASRFILRSSSTILDTPFRLIFPDSALPSFTETGLYVRQYLAISYCWHSDEFLPRTYKRHGNWPISKPFVDAILSHKDHPREGIWMDQLCIDQSSSVDKVQSIAAMDIIYRSCIRLVVLLEDVFLDEQEAKLLQKYDIITLRRFVPEGNEKHLFTSFYQKVNDARWWKRAWCLHEFGVSDPWAEKRFQDIHEATFIVNGPHGSTLKIKWVHLQSIMATALLVPSNRESHVLEMLNGQYMLTPVERNDEENHGLRSSLMARYNAVIQKGSRYLADRLTILINMAGLALAYVGDEMQTEDEVLYFSTLLALAIGEPYPLNMFHGRSIILDDRASWLAPSAAVGDTSIPRFKPGGVQGIHRVSTQYIELDMIVFGSAWEQVNDKDISCTQIIFREIVPTTQPPGHVPCGILDVAITTHSESILDESRRRFVAACIMNGYTFTARLWEQLKRDVVIPSHKSGVFEDLIPDPSLQAAAQQFVAQLSASRRIHDFGLQTFTLEDAQLFLAWLLDPSSMYYIGYLHPYRLPSTSEGHSALVTALHVKEDFFEESLENLQFAVPADVLTEKCTALRVWLLRPTKDENSTGKWKLVGKALLLGEPDLSYALETSSGKESVLLISKKRMIIGG